MLSKEALKVLKFLILQVESEQKLKMNIQMMLGRKPLSILKF